MEELHGFQPSNTTYDTVSPNPVTPSPLKELTAFMKDVTISSSGTAGLRRVSYDPTLGFNFDSKNPTLQMDIITSHHDDHMWQDKVQKRPVLITALVSSPFALQKQSVPPAAFEQATTHNIYEIQSVIAHVGEGGYTLLAEWLQKSGLLKKFINNPTPTTPLEHAIFQLPQNEKDSLFAALHINQFLRQSERNESEKLPVNDKPHPLTASHEIAESSLMRRNTKRSDVPLTTPNAYGYTPEQQQNDKKMIQRSQAARGGNEERMATAFEHALSDVLHYHEFNNPDAFQRARNDLLTLARDATLDEKPIPVYLPSDLQKDQTEAMQEFLLRLYPANPNLARSIVARGSNTIYYCYSNDLVNINSSGIESAYDKSVKEHRPLLPNSRPNLPLPANQHVFDIDTKLFRPITSHDLIPIVDITALDEVSTKVNSDCSSAEHIRNSPVIVLISLSRTDAHGSGKRVLASSHGEDQRNTSEFPPSHSSIIGTIFPDQDSIRNAIILTQAGQEPNPKLRTSQLIFPLEDFLPQ